MDDAAFGTSRTRARPDGGARMSRQAGSRHGVQDPRPGGNQAAQGALLFGTSRCRVRAEDGRGSVRLSRGPDSEESRRQVEQSHQASGDRFLRRKARNPSQSQRQHPICRVHATFARDYEYKRHGTLSLLAGIDLLTGKVHALVRDRHRSREFIEFLKCLDAAYPASTAIKLILDNHSAHISRETRAWLDTRPAGRFEFTFTPKHGSWLNLIEGFFSKFARSVLRHIRVTSKHELKERIMAGIDDVNKHPVIHTWSYKLAEAA